MPGTIHVSNAPAERIAMWIWADDVKTKADCDAIIAFATGRFTDVFLFAIDDSIADRTWLGTGGTLGDSNATSIDGKTPWAYMYDGLHAQSIKVHAWIWLTLFVYWGGTTGLAESIPDNATYNDGGVWNFHNATAREALVDIISEFVANNDVDGINFNYEETTANITEADNTAFLEAIRTEIPDIEFSFCTGASTADDSTLKFDVSGWMNAETIDTLALMGYYDDLETKSSYISSLGINIGDTKIIAGVGVETNTVKASDIKHRMISLSAEGYRNFAFFCWGSNIEDDTDIQDAINDYARRTLSATQRAITKVSLTPATSWTLTVGGVDQTTAYADVSDHLYSGSLKVHIEAAIGSENPAVIYYRDNSTTTIILIGDFEP